MLKPKKCPICDYNFIPRSKKSKYCENCLGIDLKAKTRRILGTECKLCDSRKNLVYHEVHGKRHPINYHYILSNKKDFVCLCVRCHLFIHKVGLIPKRVESIELINLLPKNFMLFDNYQ